MESIATLSLAAFFVGAVHALEPGHGKSAMAGALLGSRRPWLDPIFLGVGTATGHALGLLAFAHLTFFLAHSLAPDALTIYIEGTLGFLLISFSLFLFKRAVAIEKSESGSCRCCGNTSHGLKNSTYFLPGMGFLMGMVPCPSAIAISLTAVRAESLVGVSILAVAFGFGVALTLACVGLAVTHSSNRFGKHAIFAGLKRKGPFIAPAVFLIVGLLMLGHAITHFPAG